MKGHVKIPVAVAQALVAGAAFCGGAFEGFEKAEDLPGAVSLVWTGSELKADVSGYADLATKRPASTNDLFWIASNTKAIACALMLREIDKGLVKLDAPVADYLPEWKEIRLKDGSAPSHAPTVREVMGHTAGLAFFPKMPITQFSVQELAHMAVTNGLDHDVGPYLYSNWGIDIAMAVVERVTGRPWEQALDDEVLKPLGMTETTFFPSEEDCRTRLAKAYRLSPYKDGVGPKEELIDQLVWPYGKPGTHAEAGGGLFSTAPDVMKFFRMVAARGKLPDGTTFISERLMEEWYGLTDCYADKQYSFGMEFNRKRHTVSHGGAYGTSAEADWKRGTVRIFFTQVAMWTARSRERRRNWTRWTEQWFDRRDDVVIVSAHPDDLAGQMGLAILLSQRFNLHVVDFTHGERGCGQEKFLSGWTKATRTKEEERVCAALGAQLHWLDEVDGEAMAGRETCEKLAAILKRIRPRAVVLHWPLDIHNDHVMSAAAALRAIQLAGLEPEIYFHEQDQQSRGFTPCYWVPLDAGVVEWKDELIRIYACQNGDRMADRKARQALTRGAQCFGYSGVSAEPVAVMPGTVTAGKALIEELPGVRH